MTAWADRTPEQKAEYRAQRDAEIAEERERTYREQRIASCRKLSDLGERFGERTFRTFRVPPGDAKAAKATADATRAIEHGEKGNLWLYGDFGTGKTHLVAAAVNHLCDHGVTAVFVTALGLLERLRASYTPQGRVRDGEADVIARYVSAQLLVLDDLDKARFTGWVAERIYSLVNARYEKRAPLFVTTNLSPADLGRSWSDQGLDGVIGSAILDRLRESTTFCKIEGDSYREVSA